MTEITMTLDQLQELLDDQKREVIASINRNMSFYHWYGIEGTDITKGREELESQVNKSEYPNDFKVLSKYLTKH